MTRSQLEAVIAKGRPLVVKMADGTAYPVPHRDYISLGPKGSGICVIYDDEGAAHILSLLTMTSVSTNVSAAKDRKRQA